MTPQELQQMAQGIQNDEDLRLMLEMCDMIFTPDQAQALRSLVTEANACIDRGDFEGACQVADRFGPEYGTLAREYVKTLVNPCAAENSEQ